MKQENINKPERFIDKYVSHIDKATYLVALVESIIVLPQVIQIFRDKDASGVSLFSWTGFWIFNLIWLLYGIAHREKLIIFYTTVYGIAQIWVIIGGMMYGAKWF